MSKPFRANPIFKRTLTCVSLVLFVVFGFVSLLFLNQKAQATTNSTINFQARVLQVSGAVVADGSYNIQFNLYSASSGGSSLWTETYLNNVAQGLVTKNGYINVSLGSVVSFPTTIQWDQQLWIGMTVRGTGSCAWVACTPTDSEMVPRMTVTATPSAVSTQRLQTSSGSYTSKLSITVPTVGDQLFVIANQAAAGTYDICLEGSSSCSFAPVSGGNYANVTLNNLTVGSVAINTSLISDANNTDDLGSDTLGWKDIYSRTLKLDGSTSGTITLQAAATAGTNTITLPAATGTLAMNPMTTEGDIIYRDGTDINKLARGSNGQCLTSNTTTILWSNCSSGANAALSNLAAVAINTSLLPGADNAVDLGSASYSFKTLYADTSVISPTVYGSTSANSTLTLQGNNAVGGNTSTNANLVFKVGNSGATTAVTILNSGNVGIGATSPGAKLEVSTSDSSTTLWNRTEDVTIRNTDGTNNTWTGLGFHAGGSIAAGIAAQYYDTGNAYATLNFGTRGAAGWNSTVMVLKDGNVGVGTASPSNRLHVEGTGGGSAGMYMNSAVPSSTSSTLYNNSGNLYWNGAVVNTGGSSISGTTNYIPIFTSSTVIGDSAIYQGASEVRPATDNTYDLGSSSYTWQDIFGQTLRSPLVYGSSTANGTLTLQGNSTTGNTATNANLLFKLSGGSELITTTADRDFSGAGNWTDGGCSDWVVTGGYITNTSDTSSPCTIYLPNSYASEHPKIGHTYKLTFTLASFLAGNNFIAYVGGTAGATIYADGTYEQIITAGNISPVTFDYNTPVGYYDAVQIDNVSLEDTTNDATLRILNNGNVGVGDGDATPDRLLEVSSDAETTQLTVSNTNVGDYDAQIGFELADNSSTFTLGVDDSDSDKLKLAYGGVLGTNDYLTINSTGNVGVGDNDPDQLLEVMSSAAALTQLTVSNTNGGDYDSRIGFELADGTNTFTIGVDDSDGDQFKISTTVLGTSDRLAVTSTGYVGIGVSAPANFLLQVAGNTGPNADNTYDLGSGSYRWVNSYSRTLKVDGATSGTITLNAAAVAGTNTINLPAGTGTLALASTTLAGYGITNSVQLQASTPGSAQTGHMNISGTGIFATNILTPTIYGSSTANGTLTLQGNSTTGNTATNANLLFKLSGGSELITTTADRDFSGAGNWTDGGCSDWVVTGGYITNTSDTSSPCTIYLPNSYASEHPKIGHTYKLTFTLASFYAGNNFIAYVGGTAGATITADGTYQQTITASDNTSLTFDYNTPAGYDAVQIDNVSLEDTTNDATLRILNNGNVGVGDGDATPDRLLEVSSDAETTQLTVSNTNVGDYDAQIGFELADNSSTFTLGVDDSDSDKLKLAYGGVLGTNDYLTINSTGNVGVGDNDPDQLLEVMSSAAALTQLTVSNTNGGDYDSRIGFELADGTNTFTIGVDDSDGDQFKISTTVLGTSDRLAVTSTGYVGIGVSAPANFLLQVAGHAGPNANNTSDLGSGSYRWVNSYSRTLKVDGATSGTITLNAAAVAGTNTINLPAGTGTLALASTTLAGYGITNSVQLQASTPGSAQTGHMNISGTGIFATNILTPTIYGSSTANGTLTLQGNSTTGNTATNANLLFKLSGGSELITTTADRDFSSDTGNWADPSNDWTIGSGYLTNTDLHDPVNTYLSNILIKPGHTYKVTFTATSVAYTLIAYIGDTAGTGVTVDGTYQQNITAGNNSSLAFDYVTSSASDAVQIDNVSLEDTTNDATLRILNNGNVGVGDGDATPDRLLEVSSDAETTQLTVSNTNVGDYDAQIGFELADNSSTFTLGVDDSDSDKLKLAYGGVLGTNDYLTINSTGNVGVGDNDPDQLLEVMSSAAALTQLTVSNTNGGDYDSRIGFELADGTNTFTIGVDDSDGDQFKISTTVLGTSDRLAVTSTGYVGIGVSAPANFLLQVAGNTGPNADNTYDLGSGSYRWVNSYSRTLKVDGATSGTITLNAAAVAGTNTINLPAGTGTLALASTTLAGYGITNSVQLQASTPGSAQTGHMNISGTGIFATNILTPTIYGSSTANGTLTLQGNSTTGNTATNANLLFKLSGGSELITTTADRDFSSDTGNWADAVNDWTIATGIMYNTDTTAPADTYLTGGVLIKPGHTYKVTFTIVSVTPSTGNVWMIIGGVSGTFHTSAGTYSDSITASTNGSLTLSYDGSGTGGTLQIDNVSLEDTTNDATLRILNNGNVGVGDGDATPDRLLEVSSDAETTQLTVSNTNVGDYDAQIGFELADNSSTFTLGVDDSDSDKLKLAYGGVLGTNDYLTINSTGNVGVGDNDPDQLLEVMSSAAALTQLTVSNTNGGDYDSRIGFELADGTNTFTIGVDDSDGDQFKISTTVLGTSDRLAVTSTGYVGIGVSAPANFLLQVAGHAGPNANNTSDLGSSSYRWVNSYSRTLKVDGATSGTITLNAAAVAGTNTITLPAATGTVAIATTTLSGYGITDAIQLKSGPPFYSELITATVNRDFSGAGNWSGTNWTVGSGVYTHTAGVNNYATLANANLYPGSIISGNTYKVTFTVGSISGSGATVTPYIGTAAGTAVSVNGTYIQYIVANANNADLIFIPAASMAGSIDNISLVTVSAISGQQTGNSNISGTGIFGANILSPTIIGSSSANGTLTLQGNSTTGNTATNANLLIKIGGEYETIAATTNRDFSGAGNWTDGGCSDWVVTGGYITNTSDTSSPCTIYLPNSYASEHPKIGHTYKLTFTLASFLAGNNFIAYVGGTAGATIYAAGTYEQIITAGNISPVTFDYNTPVGYYDAVQIDNVSLVDLTNTAMTVLNNGKIGIDVSAPTYILDVSDGVDTNYAARIRNTNTGTGADGLMIQLDVANASRTTGNYFVAFAGGTGNPGTVAGKITGETGGVNYVAYTTSGADYAEYFKTDENNLPQPGELVELDASSTQAVKRSSGNAQQVLAGVVSSHPGFIGNGPICNIDDNNCDANYAKYNALISLSGQVDTKVNTSNGPIAVGDPITVSSTLGIGAKATTASYIVGYAQEPLASGQGTIKVLIRPQYYTPGYLDVIQGTALNLTGNAAIVGNAVISGRLDVNTIKVANLEVTGTATIQTLAVLDRATVNTLSVIGSADFASDINLTASVNTKQAVTKKFLASQPIPAGSVVVLDSTKDGYVTTTNIESDTKIVGVAVDAAIQEGDEIRVAVSGSVQVAVDGYTAVASGDMIVSDVNPGKAKPNNKPQSVSMLLGKATSTKDANNLIWILITLQ